MTPREFLGRFVRRMGYLLLSRPESTFMRVAYTSPRQVVLVTTRHDGEDNIWPMDFHMPLSFVPPLYCIASRSGSHGGDMVRSSGVFVVNFVPASWQEVILYCGRISGRQTDKFAGSGLKKEQADSIPAPRLAESLGAIECRVQQVVEVGDHTLFIGEVTHQVLRNNAPRLHHIDVRLKETASTFETAD